MASGFEILERNHRTRQGEIDVVARDGSTLVFVEVKDRRGSAHGEGYEAVTFQKRQRLVCVAVQWAARHGLSESQIRFDVVSIDSGQTPPRIRHDREAFDASGR